MPFYTGFTVAYTISVKKIYRFQMADPKFPKGYAVKSKILISELALTLGYLELFSEHFN